MSCTILILQFFLVLTINGNIYSVEMPYLKLKIPTNSYSAVVINNSSLDNLVNVKAISIKYRFTYVVNGGYYGMDRKSIGYLKIDGNIINDNITKDQSGMLVFNKDGNVDLIWAKNTIVGNWKNIIQNGPFIIDPGGVKGIRSNDGIMSVRMCIGKYKNGDLVLIHSNKITLFDLADSLISNEIGIDSVLNMDGGPMAGVWSSEESNFQINNSAAASNYIGFKMKNYDK